MLRQDAYDSRMQHEQALRDKQEEMNKKIMEDATVLLSVQEELAAVRKERDTLYQAKMKVEETVD
jgi:hypothetical protein